MVLLSQPWFCPPAAFCSWLCPPAAPLCSPAVALPADGDGVPAVEPAALEPVALTPAALELVSLAAFEPCTQRAEIQYKHRSGVSTAGHNTGTLGDTQPSGHTNTCTHSRAAIKRKAYDRDFPKRRRFTPLEPVILQPPCLSPPCTSRLAPKLFPEEASLRRSGVPSQSKLFYE
jgi:hypothetical protein